jgi:hypothetical protein
MRRYRSISILTAEAHAVGAEDEALVWALCQACDVAASWTTPLAAGHLVLALVEPGVDDLELAGRQVLGRPRHGLANHRNRLRITITGCLPGRHARHRHHCYNTSSCTAAMPLVAAAAINCAYIC